MSIKDIIKKCLIGISPLTNRMFIYYPECGNNNVAKYKKEITKSREEAIALLKQWLNILEERADNG